MKSEWKKFLQGEPKLFGAVGAVNVGAVILFVVVNPVLILVEAGLRPRVVPTPPGEEMPMLLDPRGVATPETVGVVTPEPADTGPPIAEVVLLPLTPPAAVPRVVLPEPGPAPAPAENPDPLENPAFPVPVPVDNEVPPPTLLLFPMPAPKEEPLVPAVVPTPELAPPPVELPPRPVPALPPVANPVSPAPKDVPLSQSRLLTRLVSRTLPRRPTTPGPELLRSMAKWLCKGGVELSNEQPENSARLTQSKTTLFIY